MTGFGRTGRMFAFQHWGLEPDLVTVAKTLSGGYVPSGALLMACSVHEAVFDSMSHAMSHGSTFAPNEPAMAAGLATLHELREQKLVEESARLGERLLELTRPLVDEFEVVRDVRGLGLAWAIEFAEPHGGGRRTYRMIERAQPGLFAQLVVVPLFTRHHILSQVAGHDMAVIRILPPLVLTDADVEEFAEALRATIKGAQRPGSLTKFALTAAGAAVARR
jgi:ornithine--oxo-acid transaminase